MQSPRLPDRSHLERGQDTRGRILGFLRYCSMNRRAPSVREIGDAVGLRSSSTVHNHLRNLEKDGRIRAAYGKSRSFELVQYPEEVCDCCGGTGWKRTETKTEIPSEIEI